MSHLLRESFVLSVIDRARNGQKVEDARVELKRQWPTEPEKAARRLAGHCNAARTPTVVWIVGVAEDGTASCGAERETHEWYAQVRACFDGIAPELVHDLKVPFEDGHATALFFDATRIPYVVKNPAFGRPGARGEVELEVPWRSGSGIRSARREDLVRLLGSVSASPSWELVGGDLFYQEGGDNALAECWFGQLKFYVLPLSGSPVVLPTHHLRAALRHPASEWSLPMRIASPTSFSRMDVSPGVQVSEGEIMINGPGLAFFDLGSTERSLPASLDGLRADIEYVAAGSDVRGRLAASYAYAPDGRGHVWRAAPDIVG